MNQSYDFLGGVTKRDHLSFLLSSLEKWLMEEWRIMSWMLPFCGWQRYLWGLFFIAGRGVTWGIWSCHGEYQRMIRSKYPHCESGALFDHRPELCEVRSGLYVHRHRSNAQPVHWIMMGVLVGAHLRRGEKSLNHPLLPPISKSICYISQDNW